MPLQQIAQQIITLADRRASTPVLVTPSYLSFRREFFVELTRELSCHTDRSIRIDWYRAFPGVRTLVSDQFAAWQVRSLNRLLQQKCNPPSRHPLLRKSEHADRHSVAQSDCSIHPQRVNERHAGAPKQQATVQITAAIGRPGGKTRDLVIGLADVRQKLPPWTVAIRMGTTEEEIARWHAA